MKSARPTEADASALETRPHVITADAIKARIQAGEVIAEIPKNSREVYRVVRRTFKGYPLVDVRVWFDDDATGELRPGRGVSLKLEVLPEIVAALSGLIDGGRR